MPPECWKEELAREWKIEVAENPVVATPTLLWTARCSNIKRVRRGLPEQMYTSYLNQFFYRFVKSHGLRFAVVSDKYGLHMDNERLPYYDVHPSELSAAQKQALGRLIRRKALAAGFSSIIFYNNSPRMSKPYFEMLASSGLKILYTTRLACAEAV